MTPPGRSGAGGRARLGAAVGAGALALACTALAALRTPAQPGPAASPEPAVPGAQDDGVAGCIACHAGIEPMHPEAALTCVDCHGGDATARLKGEAHPARPRTPDGVDERVAPLGQDLAWRQFVNPMDLRVVDRTCGTCHGEDVAHVRASLHGTTAGHLSDGYYEMGLLEGRGSRYSVFPVPRAPEPGGAVESLLQVPPFQDHLPAGELATHFTDLARKECMQCHLYSRGRAVRGRIGFDGDYRGEGCAACHVEYALDGLTASGDRTTPRNEPGHPLRHEMTRAPSTKTCTSCHYGDASIGLHFRGLSQLPPDAPGGPDIPGTTDVQLNRTFYLDDPSMVPPDVHHERGMHCIDCHTQGDVMGDGKLHGQMEYAVEITCSACHGTFSQPASLRGERGTPLEHVRREGGQVILTSKVDGREHVVPQALEVLDPVSPRHSPHAALAMTPEHERLQCYTCHAGWNVNFLGFHFSRNESLTQTDLLSGKRTPGRVTTQEKVFATWKSFYAGLDEGGRVAPYLTGFSTMGSVWNERGELVLDQVMPVTAEGLSGMTMIHHQLHSTRPTARSCVECHRTSATWGMGSPNFRLARRFAFVADRRGIEVVALDRAQLARSAALGKVVLPDVVSMALDCDPLQGHARHLYATEGGRGIHVLDVSDPTAPRRLAFVATANPRGLELRGQHLYLADGVGGLKVFDVSDPAALRLVGSLPTFDAHDVDVQWPWAYVADGAGGLAIVDVRAPIAPSLLAAVDVNGPSRVPNDAIAVATLFQYSRPMAVDDVPVDRRTQARNLCAVLDAERGLVLLDVTEPTAPFRLQPSGDEASRAPQGQPSYRGLALLSQVDAAEAQGGDRTRERDYAYLLLEAADGNRGARLVLHDVSRPEARLPAPRGALRVGRQTGELTVADFYNPPFRQRVAFVPGQLGVYLADVTTSREPKQIGSLPGILDAYSVAVEEFPLDRMVDEAGRRLKDVSHEGSRWLNRAEIERLLSVSAERLGLSRPAGELHGLTARLHLQRLDADRSGYLEGTEYAGAGGSGVDDDGDGRITLIELARHGGLAMPVEPGQPAEPLLAERVAPEGDLARLLDGLDPFAFDANRDLGLDRREASRALFAALDLDADGRLGPDELSRHPGATRAIRFGGAAAEQAFEAHDKNEDGWVSRRELALQDAEWLALDADQDGVVRLLAPEHAYQRARGLVLPGSEWPARRSELLPLPPGFDLEAFLAAFDEDGDGLAARGELAGRGELLLLADGNGDGTLDPTEIERLLGRADRGGVDVLPDDFVGRWDLDGDGEVQPDELPPGVRAGLAARLASR